MDTTLITPAALAARAGDPSLVVLDCRFDLANPDAGSALYAAGHIPGAQYVHLDQDLSGPKTGSNCRRSTRWWRGSAGWALARACRW